MTAAPAETPVTRPADAPFLSIVVPVYRTAPNYLAEMIGSVRAQSDPDWELVLVDDGSGDPDLTAALTGAAAADIRIRHVALTTNSGIVRASNRGLEIARGEFVALLDHDDIVAPDAVASCRAVVESDSDVDVLYSDEIIIGPAGEVLGEFRKPAFSPERLRGQMYTGHLGVYRRSHLDDIGGFREGFDGSQDYDLVLRATERARAVRSIPQSLYRWRTLPTSVSHSVGNEYVFSAARRALEEHLQRTGLAATVTQTDATGRYRIDRAIPDDVEISVIMPSTGGRQMVGGIDQVALTAALRRVIDDAGDQVADITVIGGNRLALTGAEAEVAEILRNHGRLVRLQGDPWSVDAINRAVLASRADLVLLIGDSVRPMTRSWLAVLMGLAQDPTIGAVGPRVRRWDGRVAAAGMAVEGAQFHPIGAGSWPDDAGPFGAWQLDREVTGLPAECVLFKRSLFLRAGGLSPRLGVPSAVVDVCLKLAELSSRTVVSVSADVEIPRDLLGPSPLDLARLRERWGSRLAADMYWRDI
ncbi:glycosyltransferase family 2 protein [Nakamurella sp. GG22]